MSDRLIQGWFKLYQLQVSLPYFKVHLHQEGSEQFGLPYSYFWFCYIQRYKTTFNSFFFLNHR